MQAFQNLPDPLKVIRTYKKWSLSWDTKTALQYFCFEVNVLFYTLKLIPAQISYVLRGVVPLPRVFVNTEPDVLSDNAFNSPACAKPIL